MRDIFAKSLGFVRRNPVIIYSLVLVFLIPSAIAFNTYFVVEKFKKNVDAAVRSKAVLAENILGFVLIKNIGESHQLNNLLAQIVERNKEIRNIKVYLPQSSESSFDFEMVAEAGISLTEDSSIRQRQNILAWNEPRGIAFLENTPEGRFWKVTKSLIDDSGRKIGLVTMAFSLSDFDEEVRKSVRISFSILFLTVMAVLLFIVANVKLLSYALTLDKLKEIDKMKDVFISMASHELKAPLISLKGNADFLMEEVGLHLQAEGRKYIENMALSAKRLEDLVNDILEVSRLEGNRLPVTMAEIDPGEVIEKSLKETKVQAIQKGLLVIYDRQKLPKVKADPERVKQILINLLSNAVKYTPQGKVEILVKVQERQLAITVADTGVGISSENQSKLFQKFSRIYNKETRSVSGTGLGLWISRQLAQRMGGDIIVESIPGVGSHFTLKLALA